MQLDADLSSKRLNCGKKTFEDQNIFLKKKYTITIHNEL
jgi:hypothetical protein